ncbi:MAG: hypothetical protein EZS28_011062 [Streblomastix strix]|uniref:Uncharacterized protein n=1 Tax=Streblomastix strix TaxID=222440 RepID=A0A5J4WEQ6_9EUKA|nr:MAG: hypothetical protein EZS28_011062 [Streblomastix strix]
MKLEPPNTSIDPYSTSLLIIYSIPDIAFDVERFCYEIWLETEKLACIESDGALLLILALRSYSDVIYARTKMHKIINTTKRANDFMSAKNIE